MERYTVQQRVQIVKFYYENSSSVRACFRALREIFGVQNRPSERTIRRIVEKFEETGSVCDITHFFLWGFLKSKVYANNPKTIDELKNNITATINEIEFQLCENVMENWVKRIGLLKKSRGGHLNDIVFHN
ncbi:hypothetical protein ANTQUA_LOCUS625 [Anthophora quadrimaculata]